MENLRSGSSGRKSSFRIWRKSSMEVFSNSSLNGEDDDDDEEALKWAALEKLPTYSRVRKGILTDQQSSEIIDVNSLGLIDKRNLIERLVKNAEEDHEQFLLKLKDRIDRVGLDMPTIEVRFENLSVEAEAFVGAKALPTIFNFSINILQDFLNYLHILPSKKKQFPTLHGVSGIVKPQRMTLLLGPPSSGKTTLLLALAGKLGNDLKSSGKVTYNGYGMEEFVAQRTSAYISQYDLHIGEMTVRETLAFSARCQGVGTRYEMLEELSRREKAASIVPDPNIDIFMKAAAVEGQEINVVADYILKILGLEGCADTMVGDEMTRGISGGQKRRVTTGEMLVGPARALFMDEISNGLDSSTTFQIVNSLRQSIHILRGTALISLLQPSPETYDLFDDIILLSDGLIVYQGPRQNIPEFFEFTGFRCPARKGIADFLQEVTSQKDQEQYWASRDKPYRFVSAKEFAEAFQSFHIGQRLSEELARPFDKSKSHPAALTTKKYGVTKKELLKACISREFLLMKRNSFAYTFKMIQFILRALIVVTIFLRTEMHRNTLADARVYFSALFFSVSTIMLNGLSDLTTVGLKLPVFYKQRDLLFYPSWAYALPTWILKIPITFLEALIWMILTYYGIGFDPNIGRFFEQYLILILTGQMASSLFRMAAALGRNLILAYTIGMLSVIILLVLGGFVIPRDYLNNFWIWGYWSSPMMYAQIGLSVNEFLCKSWNHFPSNSTEALGISFLKSRAIFPEAYWYWVAVGALTGYVFLFNFVFTLALKYLNPFGKPHVVLSTTEAFSVKNADQTLELIEHPKSRKSSFGRGNASNSNAFSVTQSVRPGGSNKDRREQMVLPFQPLCITFDEIRFAVDMPEEMKDQGINEDRLQLLKGVSGAFRPGILTALMGASGAGKTTLMDVLAGRKTRGYIEGNITISGYPKKQQTFARISGYCEQTDIHSPNVTVFESLIYSAWLRLPSEVKSNTKKRFVEEVMELVDLTTLRESLVGLPGVNGLSMEQRKRLTIAVELVANPSIIFMDEPTSGLDARAAAIVMRTVRNTVGTGRTVLCTIHQPSIDIFDAFDELYLLKRGGGEMYVSPVGRHACHLIRYFEEIEGVPKITNGRNPATWIMEVTAEAQEAALGIDFTDIYKNSELYRRNKALIKELSRPPTGSKDLYFPTQYSQPFLTQCMACLWKQHWSYWRNPPYFAVRLLSSALVSLVMGTIFWDLGSKRNRQQDVLNAMGSMYVSVLFLGNMNTSLVQPIVAIERSVFYRERAAGFYSALPYAFGQVVIELPYIFVQSIIYGVTVYAMIGFEWTVSKFFWYLFFMYLSFLYFTLYGMMIVALTPNHSVAAIVSVFFFQLWSTFSGFVIPLTRIPIWWRWYYWACPVAWTLYGMIASQYGDVKEQLDNGETMENFVRSYFGFRHDFVGIAAIVLVGISSLFGLIFAFSIKAFNFQKR